MTAPKLRAGLLLVAFVVLILPGTAAATPVLVHDHTTVIEGSPRDGVIAGGDTITIVERVRNTGAGTVPGPAGTLTSAPEDDVDVTQGVSTYPAIAPSGTEENAVAFQITLPQSLPCGTVVELSLALTASGVSETVPVAISTGFAGVGAAGINKAQPTDIPNATASLVDLVSLSGSGGGTSTIDVPGPVDGQTVRGIEVRLNNLHYPLGHLRISLRGPNGREVILLDHRGGAAQDLVSTVIASAGADPAQLGDPSATTVHPEESFDALLGNPRAGKWKLVFQTDDSTVRGSLGDWRIDFTLAACVPQYFASLVATPAQVLPDAPVMLDASGTVVDGPHYAYTGAFTTISGGTTAQAHVSFHARGHYTVAVNVTDSHTNVFTKSAEVVVSAPPVAVLPSPAPALTGHPVDFDATGSSDPVDSLNLLHYAWSVDGGAFSTGIITDAVSFAVSFATPGAHHVTVRVTNSVGAIDEETANVTVTRQPPVAHLALGAPPPVVIGRSTVLDATGPHDAGAIQHYAWDLEGDGTFELDGGTSPTLATDFAGAAPGSHTVGVKVTDDNTAYATATVTFVITDAPVAGSIQAMPAHPRPKAPVMLTVIGASDADGGIDHYEWDFDDGGPVNPGAASAIHTFTTRATHTITVHVVDTKGVSSTTSLALEIGGVPPVAVLTATPNPVVAGATAHFDASTSHDPDSAISRYFWDLNNDGVFELDTGLIPTATASYANAGTLTVRVRVIDEDGNVGNAGISLTISPARASSAPGAGNGPPAAPEGAAADPDGADGGAPAFTAALAADAIQTQKAVLRAGVVVACRTNLAATCTVRIELSGKDARRLGLARNASKPVVLARATVRTSGARPGVAKLRLSAAAAGKLRRAARVTVLVTGEATTASGDKAKLSRSILLRRR